MKSFKNIKTGDHFQMRITLKLNIKKKNKDLFKIEMEYVICINNVLF